MRTKILATILWIFLGAFLGMVGATEREAEKPLSSRIAPLLAPAQVTRLQWTLMQLELSQVQEQIRTLGKGKYPEPCCANYSYDFRKERMVATLYVSMAELEKLTLDELRSRLERGAGYIVASAGGALMALPYPLETDTADFEVRFTTMDVAARGELVLKEIAVFEDGKLRLAERELRRLR